MGPMRLPGVMPTIEEVLPMAQKLNGKAVAVVATDGFEQVELTEPVKALKDAGATVHVVAPKSGQIQGWNHHDKADKVPVDVALDGADPNRYDALMLPGGVVNPDALRLEPKAIDFIRHFVQTGKPIAAICHGPWTLIDAGGVRGKRMTSWPSLKADLSNAGANWVDEPVVTDQGLVTSRNPQDLPAFCPKMIEEFAEGKHSGHRHAAE
jgi:protease I